MGATVWKFIFTIETHTTTQKMKFSIKVFLSKCEENIFLW